MGRHTIPIETICCQGNFSHRIAIDAGNLASALDHDVTAEQTVIALGGQPPTCMTVLEAFADPIALTAPNDPRFVAYCADPRFVSDRGMAQVKMMIDYSGRTTRQQRQADIKRVLLEATASMRMRWLVRWLDVVAARPGGNAFHASAQFVVYRISGASGAPQIATNDLQRILLEGWECSTEGLPDWSALSLV